MGQRHRSRRLADPAVLLWTAGHKQTAVDPPKRKSSSPSSSSSPLWSLGRPDTAPKEKPHTHHAKRRSRGPKHSRPEPGYVDPAVQHEWERWKTVDRLAKGGPYYDGRHSSRVQDDGFDMSGLARSLHQASDPVRMPHRPRLQAITTPRQHLPSPSTPWAESKKSPATSLIIRPSMPVVTRRPLEMDVPVAPIVTCPPEPRETPAAGQSARYTEAHVLMLTWAFHDLHDYWNATERVGALDYETCMVRDTFVKYGYRVNEFPIPLHNSREAVREELSKFLRKGSSKGDTLLIVYYNGHGDLVNHELQFTSHHPDMIEPYLAGAVTSAGATMAPGSFRWHDISSPIFSAHRDVLTILECCHAGAADVPSPGWVPKPKAARFAKHIIAAAGFERETVVHHALSMTPRLCGVLNAWDEADHGPLTTERLVEISKMALQMWAETAQPHFSRPVKGEGHNGRAVVLPRLTALLPAPSAVPRRRKAVVSEETEMAKPKEVMVKSLGVKVLYSGPLRILPALSSEAGMSGGKGGHWHNPDMVQELEDGQDGCLASSGGGTPLYYWSEDVDGAWQDSAWPMYNTYDSDASG